MQKSRKAPLVERGRRLRGKQNTETPKTPSAARRWRRGETCHQVDTSADGVPAAGGPHPIGPANWPLGTCDCRQTFLGHPEPNGPHVPPGPPAVDSLVGALPLMGAPTMDLNGWAGFSERIWPNDTPAHNNVPTTRGHPNGARGRHGWPPAPLVPRPPPSRCKESWCEAASPRPQCNVAKDPWRGSIPRPGTRPRPLRWHTGGAIRRPAGRPATQAVHTPRG